MSTKTIIQKISQATTIGSVKGKDQSAITLITHGGCFHADDVLSTALLKLTIHKVCDDQHREYPSIGIIRVTNPSLLDNMEKLYPNSIVYDIGYGEYDHHRSDSEVRENGLPYAAVGLIWRDVAPLFGGGDVEWEEWMDANIFQPIDLQDNGQGYNPLSLFLSAFNPNWDEPTGSDTAFSYAVDIAYHMLQRQIERHNSELRARKVLDEYKYNKVVVLQEFIPYNYLSKFEKPKCVITPSNRYGFDLHTLNNQQNNKPKLPESWLTKPPAGCTFVHKGLFIANFTTVQDAVAAANDAFWED